MKKIFYFILLAFVSINSNAQAPIIEWQKSLGGSGTDRAKSIQQTSDGGYIVVGNTGSNDGDVTGYHGVSDIWVVKLTNIGGIDWQKCLGGIFVEEASSIQQTSDGGYIIAGYTGSNDGDVTGNHGLKDYWVVKLTSTGNIDWQKCIGGSDDEQAASIQQTSDGGYIITGNSYSNNGDVTGNHGLTDFWVVKLTNTGVIDWQKSLGGNSYDEATSIIQSSDGGYIVAGGTRSINGDVTSNHGLSDCWVVKLTNTGVIDWQKSLGGTGSDFVLSIQQTSDGGFIFAGFSDSNNGDVTGNHGSFDCWVVKLTSTGTIDWEKSLGGAGWDWAYSIQQISDGGYIVAGESESNNGDVTGNNGSNDYWVVKLMNSGNIGWQKSLGGTNIDKTYSIQQTSDGGYIVAGESKSNDGDVTGNHGSFDCWIVKLEMGLFGGTTSSSLTNLCLSGSSTLSVIDYYFALTGTIQWEQSPDGINNWINVIGGSGATTDTYTTGSLSSTTFYRARISHPSYADTVSTVTQVTVDLMPDVATNLINANTVQSNATGVSYQWIDCDNGNSIINGETSQTFTAQIDGNYAVIITNNTCLDTSACINLNTLGVNEFSSENISIHPNPTNSTFTISGIDQSEISSIEILDITGKLLFNANSPINIDLSNYENGVYLFRIIGEKNYVGKIVKE